MIPSTAHGTPRFIVMGGDLVDTFGRYPEYDYVWGFHKVVRKDVV